VEEGKENFRRRSTEKDQRSGRHDLQGETSKGYLDERREDYQGTKTRKGVSDFK